MTESASLRLDQVAADTLQVVLSGDWRLSNALPGTERIDQALADAPAIRTVVLDALQVTVWDSGLLTFLVRLRTVCSGRQTNLDSNALPQGALKLLALPFVARENFLTNGPCREETSLVKTVRCGGYKRRDAR